MTAVTRQVSRATRCPACQLQLCKGRNERPHAALSPVTGEGNSDSATRYLCATCGAKIERNQDPSKPGWSHQR